MTVLKTCNRVHMAHKPKIDTIWYCTETYTETCCSYSGFCYIPAKNVCFFVCFTHRQLSLLDSNWKLCLTYSVQQLISWINLLFPYLSYFECVFVCMGQVPAEDLGFSNALSFGIIPSVFVSSDHPRFCLQESKTMACFFTAALATQCHAMTTGHY